MKNQPLVNVASSPSLSGLLKEGWMLLFGADPNSVDSCGWSVLLRAVTHGWSMSAGLLIVAGADVEAAREGDGWRPLHMAAYYGRLEMVELLLAAGADPLARSGRGETPAQIARYNKCGQWQKVCELLPLSEGEIVPPPIQSWSCPLCGHENPDNAEMCLACGHMDTALV